MYSICIKKMKIPGNFRIFNMKEILSTKIFNKKLFQKNLIILDLIFQSSHETKAFILVQLLAY